MRRSGVGTNGYPPGLVPGCEAGVAGRPAPPAEAPPLAVVAPVVVDPAPVVPVPPVVAPVPVGVVVVVLPPVVVGPPAVVVVPPAVVLPVAPAVVEAVGVDDPVAPTDCPATELVPDEAAVAAGAWSSAAVICDSSCCAKPAGSGA